MFFKKKKMVDLRDLPRQRVPQVIKKEEYLSSSTGDFIDFTKKPLPLRALQTTQEKKTETSTFNFFDTPSNSNNSLPTSSSDDSELKELIRKVSMQVSELDSQIYKIEQRLEVVERKTGVNSGSYSNADSNSNNNLIGW